MEKVLVSGCSFLNIAAQDPLPPFDKINYQKYNIIGDVAAGNLAIAARVRHEVLKQHYDRVVVVWSGINRIDIEKTRHQYNEMPQTYPHVLDFGDMVWFLSGGICGSWHSSCPEPVLSQFHSAFRNQTMLSASDSTLKIIVDTQKFLTERSIDYTMSFIYDIHRDYNSMVDVFGNRSPRTIAKDRWPHWLALEHCLGQVDTASEWYNQVDWAKFPAEQTAFEYCSEREMLQPDKFHPTKDGLKQWFSHQLDIYLTDS
jgi:hypothetical protein